MKFFQTSIILQWYFVLHLMRHLHAFHWFLNQNKIAFTANVTSEPYNWKNAIRRELVKIKYNFKKKNAHIFVTYMGSHPPIQQITHYFSSLKPVFTVCHIQFKKCWRSPSWPQLDESKTKKKQIHTHQHILFFVQFLSPFSFNAFTMQKCEKYCF